MSSWIFKACSRFLYSVVFLGFAACFAPANASVCFLPDAENCGTNDIVTQCDGGQRYFVAKPPAGVTGQTCREKVQDYHSMNGPDGRPRLSYLTCTSAGDCDYMGCVYTGETDCKTNADRRSYKNAHYECYLDTATGCWYQTETPCNEYDEPASNASYPLDSPEDGKACKPYTWDVEHHLCSDKGIASTQKGTRTTYDCVPIVPRVSGCDGYNLSSPISGYDCDQCEPDVYKNDYDGNYNYSGKGNTVYSCSKSEGCSSDYSLSASDATAKENTGQYKCKPCTPTVTDSDGNKSNGATLYKCGEITTTTTSCPSGSISAAEANKLMGDDKCYNCTGCTPTTKYWANGENYFTESNPTVFTCSKPDCTGKSKASDCGTGTEFVAAGDCAKFSNGEACGDCIDCNDETNPINKCFGKYTCKEDGRHGVGAVTCTCGNVSYYDRCEVEETCNTNSDSKWYYDLRAWGYCYATTNKNETETNGHYYLGDKCKKVDLTQVYSYAICNGVDCNGNKGEAYGLKKCPNDEGAEGATTKECGGYKYFSACRETCNTTADSNWYSDLSAWGYCYATTNKNETETNGHYYLGDKCEKVDGTKVYSYGICNGVDCNGNKGEAYGLKKCASGLHPNGTIKECGGETYAERCLTECNYEDDAESCADKGKDFNALCHDENDKEWGECKDKE